MDSPTKKKLVEQVVGSVLNNDEQNNETAFSLEELQNMENDAQAVLGGSDPDNCSYKDGYVARQALYACLSCAKDEEMAGMCLACSLKCHNDCELIELYTKRNFRCDCCTGKFHRKCEIEPEIQENNEKNIYNHNFIGKYCKCARPYPDPDCPPELEDDEMIQCVICEDWWHGTHLDLSVEHMDDERNSEMICTKCLTHEQKTFIRRYSLQNKCKENTSETCLMPKEDFSNQVGGSFFADSFRSRLCKCDDCLLKMKEAEVEFLLDEKDTIEAYESTSRDQSQQLESESNSQINTFMDNLDHRGQVEVAHGMSLLKTAMSQMIESAGDSGVVTEEHVEIFKRKIQEDLERRKRRRIDFGAE